MRKIIWMGGTIPQGMSSEKYKNTAVNLAAAVGGECVGFGDTNVAIIGDDIAEVKLEVLTKEAENKKMAKITGE